MERLKQSYNELRRIRKEAKKTKLESLLVRPAEYGPPEIASSEIVLGAELGKGSYGTVYLGRCRGSDVAVKVPKKQDLSQKEIDDLKQEVTMMSQLYHPNVVLFMGACYQVSGIKLVTEKMSCDLDNYLRSPRAKSQPLCERLKLIKGAARGMSWIHGSNVIHRDLKPANLLMDKFGNVKVTDFGFSKTLKGNATMKDTETIKGSALWMSPEILSNRDFDKRADVYSFGIILWEIYTLNDPWTEVSTWPQLIDLVVNKHARPSLDEKCPKALKILINACWSGDIRRRPHFDKIVQCLDQAILEEIIHDEVGQDFWQEHFYEEGDLDVSVPWDEFVTCWEESTGIDTTNLLPFKQYFVKSQSEQEVTLETFSSALAWMGSSLFNSKESLQTELRNAHDMIKAEWFHGLIDAKMSNILLENRLTGTFLVRLSTSTLGKPFALSYKAENIITPQHLRIGKEKGTHGENVFYSDNPKLHANSLVGLVNLLKGTLKLGDPCPRPQEPVDY